MLTRASIHPAHVENLRILNRIEARQAEIVAAAKPAQVVQKTAPAPALPDGLSPALGRILRPQAAYRWLLPAVAAITPQYIEMTLRGALAGNHVQQWELFDLMLDTWPELASCAAELTEGVQRMTPIFTPYAEEDESPTDSAVERCKLVSSAMRRMRPDIAKDENDLDGTIKDLVDGWFRGVTVLEVDWQSVRAASLGQIIAPRATFWVHPVCFAWSAGGELGLRTDASGNLNPANLAGTSYQPMPSTVAPFPEHKFLLGIHKAKSGTALGGALLRPLAWWWCAANFASDWVLNLAQTFGLPFRWANFDPNAPQATVDAICTMLQNMGSAGWAAFPAGTTLELKEAGKGSDHSPQGELLDRADRYARMLVLGQTQSGGKGAEVGGQAFGAVETDVKATRISAAAQYVASMLNAQLVPAICTLNYGDADEAPEIGFVAQTTGDLSRAQAIQTLATAGVKIGQGFVRRAFDIPDPEEDEETIGGKPAPAAVAPEKNAPADEPTATPGADEDGDIAARAAMLRRLAGIEDDALFAKALGDTTAILAGETTASHHA
jgi:phage gp29-like protein